MLGYGTKKHTMTELSEWVCVCLLMCEYVCVDIWNTTLQIKLFWV